MLDMQSDELRRALEAITVETLTPIEALNPVSYTHLAQFDPALCAAAVTAQFGQSPEALGLANMPCVIAAAGALLTTLRDLQKNCLLYTSR